MLTRDRFIHDLLDLLEDLEREVRGCCNDPAALTWLAHVQRRARLINHAQPKERP